MGKKGKIYVITNNINGKQYVGQTVRDVAVRFNEHCFDHRSNSKIHKAIDKYGWQNFKVEVIETPELDQLDEREKFWIKELDTQKNGYNILEGGQPIQPCQRILIKENGLVFPSLEEMGTIISELTSWWRPSATRQILRNRLQTGKDFLGYHIEKIDCEALISPIDVLEDWIKTLNVRYTGKHVYCEELDKEFDTIAEAAKYLIDNKLYQTTSVTPIQSVVTAIGKNINGKTEYLKGVSSQLHFIQMPGTAKQTGADPLVAFKANKIYCPQLDKEFNSQIEAAKYMIDNNIWKGIKLKTAKLRISDVVRGYFPHYRGYTFEKK